MYSEELIKFVEYFRQSVAPEVLAYGAQVAQINSVSALIGGVLMLLLGAVFLHMTKPFILAILYKHAGNAVAEFIYEHDLEPFVILFIVAGSALTLFGVLNLTYIWNWVGVFNPELRFIKDIFNTLV